MTKVFKLWHRLKLWFCVKRTEGCWTRFFIICQITNEIRLEINEKRLTSWEYHERFTMKINLKLYVPCIILQCVDEQRDAILLINNFYSTVFLAVHVSNEFTCSTSGALPNILYYTVQSVQSCYQASLAARS